MVQGEKLVIRKLVVAGIVSAEKSYLDCLNVMKEVRASPVAMFWFLVFMHYIMCQINAPNTFFLFTLLL